MSFNSDSATGFKIGTAAKMAGISPNTIRTWMRRDYFSTSIETSSGEHLLSSEDMKRLKTLKSLVDLGDTIGRIARLNDEALEARLEELRSNSSPDYSNDVPSLADLHAAFVRSPQSTRLNIASSFFWNTSELHAVEDLEEHCREKKDTAIALVDYQNGNPLETQQIVAFAFKHPEVPVVVIFDFMQRSSLKELSNAGVHLLRWPINTIMLERYLYGLLPMLGKRPSPDASLASPPDKLLTESQLTRLSESDPTLECECPRHVSSIVSSLSAFEEYSKNCVITSPQDKALHDFLHRETARARHIMELALIRVCREDGIEIPPA
ncbi:MerR family transcriptional regulator [Pelagicoccus sp. SDUM812003]|uniref:MerR family transcriptional regulator n=1 Tax=Pelagicoccus sp. SDUM812003 TaxID=3041267 RepID=UPI00280D12E6|nr:MerR family transcriptional regulator [Pelagicoccus sp. SDUM812003]MDQ8201883.1 MerR family transcriptional regulator [Pelagicoccus sp. SDUM812003]